jgi:hypothetical protein
VKHWDYVHLMRDIYRHASDSECYLDAPITDHYIIVAAEVAHRSI